MPKETLTSFCGHVSMEDKEGNVLSPLQISRIADEGNGKWGIGSSSNAISLTNKLGDVSAF